MTALRRERPRVTAPGTTLRLALREMRGGTRGLRVVLLCLAIGVAAIAAVGSFREGIARGLARDGRALLGGDISVLTGGEEPPAVLRTWLEARGAHLAEVVEMRSLLVAPSGDRALVELKAVDGAYPLVGSTGLDPASPLHAALSGELPGLVADPLVLQRLGLHVGDRARLGNAAFRVAGTITAEPDRVSGPLLLAPRVMVSIDALPATGLIQPGSLITYLLRAALPPGADAHRVAADLDKQFSDQGWRVRQADGATPGLQRFVDQLSLFLTLVGLTALLVGGIGVANGVRAWTEARARSIAVLRCLGASSGMVLAVVLIQVLALCAAGILAGVAAGAALPAAALALYGNALPIPARIGLYPWPLLLAAAYGLLTAGAFALWPVARAARIPGAALFRDAVLPEGVRPGPWVLAVNAAIAAALVALLVAASPDRRFAAWFCAAAVATLLLFRLGGALVIAAARRLPAPGLAWARLGLANLHRPGNATPLMLVSVGLGLSTLAAVALIEGNIEREMLRSLPTNAPSFFFVDIQGNQLDRFQHILAAQPGAGQVDTVPSLRARIVSVNGTPADHVKATPDTAWALRGDRGITYAAELPPGTHLTAGQWWPADYNGPPLVSFDAGLAKGWGVGVGDTIRVNILGRDVDLKIASLRDIAWRTLGLNYAMVASPGLLSHAPHEYVATVRAAPGAEASILRAVTDALPNVTGVQVSDVLATLAAFISKIATALAAAGGLTLASGALVLVGAVAAGQRRRTAEAVILKAVGATRAQVRAAWLAEFGILGACAGLLAALVGTLASWGVTRFVLRADWAFLPGTLALTILGCTALTLALGWAGTEAALRARAAPLLRNE
jgi:putative ABC transport system permease protein